MNNTSINERIAWIISVMEISQSAFAKALDTSASRVSNIISGRNKPDSDFLSSVAKTFTNVNALWLLTGAGQPLLNQKSSQANDKGYPILDQPYGLAEVLADIDHRHAQVSAYQNLGASSSTGFKKNEIIEGPDPEKDRRIELEHRLQDIHLAAYRARSDSQLLLELTREVYEIATPFILEQAAKGLGINPYLMDWRFASNARNAWGIIRGFAIGLYPQYPVLHYFIDFADPYRKIAVFVEELEDKWLIDNISRQDRLLALHGWKVFRIPSEVAVVFEEDVLPNHLKDVHWPDIFSLNNKLIRAERNDWDDKLSKTTIDGFFRWLKKNYFVEEINSNIRYREQDSITQEDDNNTE